MPDCESYCQEACEVSCQGTCEVTCQGECQEGCETSCQGTCQTGCEEGCENGYCVLACEYGCQGICELECQGGCQEGCESACQGYCETYCEDECEYGHCQEACETSCQGTCEVACQTGCETVCQNWCESFCQGTCESGGCQGTCELTCQTECETGCEISCQGTCEVACEAACEAGECQCICNTACQTCCEIHPCQTECELACQASCKSACQDECEVQCEATCEWGCQDACELGTCQLTCEINTCQDECEVQCQTGCEIHPCQTTCELACQLQCELGGCQLECDAQCQDACEWRCQATCDLTCQNACEVGCEEACDTTCQTTCETGACQVECDAQCQGACEIHPCQMPCEIGTCQTVCESACQAECENQCEAPCETHPCQTGCELECQWGAEVGSCVEACEIVCETRCESIGTTRIADAAIDTSTDIFPDSFHLVRTGMYHIRGNIYSVISQDIKTIEITPNGDITGWIDSIDGTGDRRASHHLEHVYGKIWTRVSVAGLSGCPDGRFHDTLVIITFIIEDDGTMTVADARTYYILPTSWVYSWFNPIIKVYEGLFVMSHGRCNDDDVLSTVNISPIGTIGPIIATYHWETGVEYNANIIRIYDGVIAVVYTKDGQGIIKTFLINHAGTTIIPIDSALIVESDVGARPGITLVGGNIYVVSWGGRTPRVTTLVISPNGIIGAIIDEYIPGLTFPTTHYLNAHIQRVCKGTYIVPINRWVDEWLYLLSISTTGMITLINKVMTGTEYPCDVGTALVKTGYVFAIVTRENPHGLRVKTYSLCDILSLRRAGFTGGLTHRPM